MNHINLIRKNQNLSKPEDSLKVWGVHTTTTFSTLSRFAVVAGFGRRAEDEHVASIAEAARKRHRPQRRAGASSGRRPGRWGRSTGAPGQLEDRLPCLGGGHSEAFWDVWNLNHLISISILVGFLGTTFGVWFFVELFSVVFPNFSVVLRL